MGAGSKDDGKGNSSQRKGICNVASQDAFIPLSFNVTRSKEITCLCGYLSLTFPFHPQEYETPKVSVYVALIFVSPGFSM